MTPVAQDALQAELGESPAWCARTNRLSFVDIRAPALFSLDPATGRLERFSMADLTGMVALARQRGIDPATLVEAMRTGAGAGASVVLERHGPFMAWALDEARPANPISRKDALALGELLDDATAAAREALTCAAHARLRKARTP